MQTQRHLMLGWVLVPFAWCTGCQENGPTGPSPALTVQPPVDEPHVAAAIEYVHPEPLMDVRNMPDPFKRRWMEEEVPRIADGVLGRFDLDQLRVVAVVVGTANPVAMVEDPHGLGHVLRVGMLVGKEQARLMSIEPEGVLLEQRIYAMDRGTVKQPVLLPLDGPG